MAHRIPHALTHDPQLTVAVQRNVLYLYGGIFEAGNREYTLDDFYTLDLSKMERYNCLKECPIDALEWHDSEDEDSSSESGSESDSEDGSGDERDRDEEDAPEGVEYVEEAEGEEAEDHQFIIGEHPEPDGIDPEERKRLQREKDELRDQAKKFLGVSMDDTRTQEDVLSTPLPGETVRHFYDRSKEYWQGKAFAAAEREMRGKELRRAAFTVSGSRKATMAEHRDDESQESLRC